MKSGSAQSSSLINRWLSRTSNSVTTTFEDDKDVELRSNSFSPPPLTDSSSTTASASTIITPTTSVAPSSPHWKSFRNGPGKRPCTPPTRHCKLPVVPTSQKLAVSLPVASHGSALILARTNIKLHRILNHDPMRRALMFDISLPSSFIRQAPPAVSPSASMAIVVRRPLPAIQPRLITTPLPMSEHDLSQFATTPPVSRIRITCDLIPWTIDVRGRTTLPNDPTSFVRVIDVLDGIYTSLREGVTSAEWSRAERAFRDHVKKAYSRRCHVSRSFTLTGYEENQGVRRIDYLQEKTMFLGLTIKSPGGGGSDRTQNSVVEDSAWVMMLGPRPNP